MLMNLKNKIRYHDLTEISDAGVIQLVIEENIRPIVIYVNRVNIGLLA